MKLLPDDAAERCEGRVALVVTRLPGLEIEAFSHFADKRDLVEATMASGEGGREGVEVMASGGWVSEGGREGVREGGRWKMRQGRGER